MAEVGYVKSLLGGLTEERDRVVMQRIFEYVLNNLRMGVPTHQARSENFQQYFLNSTTPSTANTEFSIAHGLNSTPVLAYPAMDLSQAGAKIVPLEVSRAADGARIYLKSTSTSAPFTLIVE